MRVLPLLLVGPLVASAVLAVSSSYAQTENDEAGELLEVIEVQQRRLDEQEREIADQKRAQQQLRRQVEALQERRTPVAPSATTVELTPTEQTELKILLERESRAAKVDWPGSFDVYGSKTRFKISGFAELDVTHDNNAIGTPSAFVTAAIATDGGTPPEGSDGLTNFSVQVSRLAVETRTPVSTHQLKTFISIDFFGDFSSTSPDPRLREAYGTVSDILLGGELLLGQTWSTMTYLPSFPNTLDFEGPPAGVATRRAMLRWTRELRRCLKLKLAFESPNSRTFTDADAVSEWPDGIMALAWETDMVRIQGAVVRRDLRASVNDDFLVSEDAWGANIAGRLNMPWSNQQDFLTFSYVSGDGIGGLLNDAPTDAIYDFARDRLYDIPVNGGWLGFQHWWNPDFYSVVSYGELKANNREIQPPDAYRHAKYSSANLVWTPFPNWLFGFEALHGSREDKDGARGSVTRFQFTSRLSF